MLTNRLPHLTGTTINQEFSPQSLGIQRTKEAII